MKKRNFAHAISEESIRKRTRETDRWQLTYLQRGVIAADREWGPRFPGPTSPMPNFRWEIDSTTVDLYVLDQKTGNLIRRRPTLYTVLECYCGAPIGMHLDVHPPSTLGFLAALRNAILPKTYVRTLFPSVQCDWQLCGFPVEVFVDNGKENWSHHTQAALRLLRAGIHYTPPYVPRYKRIVERFNRTLNQLLFHRIPGTTLGKRLPRRELDPKRDAKKTLHELAEALHIVMVDEYMHRPVKAFRHMTRRQRWLQGLELHELQLPAPGLAFDLAFCTPSTRVLRETGIHIGPMVYQSDELSVLRGQVGVGQEMQLFADGDKRRIYLMNPISGNPIEVPCVTPVEAPLPYASLVALGDEEVGVTATKEDEAIVAEARKRKSNLINREILVRAKGEVSKVEVKARFSRAPSFQDQAKVMQPEEPARRRTPNPLREKLKRRLRGE